ncbi:MULTISPECIES: hypothetical protein [unclassified Rhizobacter]|jgi:hypothetical protein|uniref:hypothetical protein n=1 Tax=unclassified Rhizobacter TaxID=2640088 RepID=UPI0006F2DFC9|nr:MULTISPECIES: hypothetical protein [unclassified Rhizobacter]KQU67785.1 hypothetical protein ASC88_07405 [Rhizobacter sp. Root29]KQW15329.1 hypothetical protein ASC98_14510 [Rhizobacter sp. Root1238]
MSAYSTRAHPPRRAPTVGARVAGHRFNNEDRYERIYFGATSDFGELNGSIWYRLRDATYGSRANAWRISMEVCGRRIHFESVIDDFGNLVAVS